MRLAFLSAGTGWHVADLLRATTCRGHLGQSVDFRLLGAGCGLACEPLAGFDAVLVRTMPPGSLEQVVFRMDLLHQSTAYVLNSPRALETAIDKYLTTARLHQAGLPVPRTFVCQTADAALEGFAALGGDVVVKPLFGSEGRGMLRVSDPDLAWRTFRTLERTGAVLYLQESIAHPGWDLRVFLLGGKPLAAMRRYAQAGHWRTNVAQGGRTEAVALGEPQTSLAVRAAEVVGVEIAGVDLLQDASGRWLILEVNAVPGWRALAPTCGIDVADALVAYIERRLS
ncbi:MAG: RimK family alpha-L-glutamate ligase [Gemmataceae bacterium]